MTKIFLIMTFLLNLNVFAKITSHDSDKGNGGSINTAAIIQSEVMFDETVEKLKKFFTQNKIALKSVFPEFEIEEFIKTLSDAKVEIHGAHINGRGNYGTCEVFPVESKLKCHFTFLELISRFPRGYNTLIFQLYLRLIGIQGSSDNPYSGMVRELGERLELYMVKTRSERHMSEKTTSYGLENSMFVETVNANFTNMSDISEEKLIKNSLDMAKARCKEKRKKVTFSDAHIFNKLQGKVVLRYICD